MLSEDRVSFVAAAVWSVVLMPGTTNFLPLKAPSVGALPVTTSVTAAATLVVVQATPAAEPAAKTEAML